MISADLIQLIVTKTNAVSALLVVTGLFGSPTKKLIFLLPYYFPIRPVDTRRVHKRT